METTTSTQTLQERIIEAIVLNGGQAEDTKYCTDKMVAELGSQLAKKGIKERTPNPAYIVRPLNDIKGNIKNFSYAYQYLAELSFKVESNDVPMTIELIQCEPDTIETTLKEIDNRGFMPAPSPYLLGLGVQYPDVVKERKWIVALDEQNLLPNDEDDELCFLLLWSDEKTRNALGLMGPSDKREQGIEDYWWFAVVRKPSKS